jgi:type II secretory pathway pseudopilin PulG
MRHFFNGPTPESRAHKDSSRLAIRSGVALLEAIVALVIFAMAGVAALSMAAEVSRAVRDARVAEEELRGASAFLEAVALWPRADLDRRLGDRRQGPWLMRVDRPAPELYVITLSDSLGAATILRTSLFRPEAFGESK